MHTAHLSSCVTLIDPPAGRMFCNLEGLKSGVGKRVRWHTSVQGNEVDVHNAHWCGSLLFLLFL